jgi:predicted Zn-dependent peptidase
MQTQDRNNPGHPPVVNINKTTDVFLANGLKVMIVENHKLPKVTFKLTIDNPPLQKTVRR